MENTGLKLFVRLAAVFALVSCTATVNAGGYENLSAQIIKCAEINALKKIAVLEFTARGGADKSDSEYAAEKIGLYLAGSKITSLIERTLLERVLKETRLSSVADGIADKAAILKNMLSLDAVVTGAVFADGEKLKVLARLIELKTGRVLMAAEAEAGRLPPNLPDNDFSDMEPPAVSFPELPAEWNDSGPFASRAAFRDAVADSEVRSCLDRRRMLGTLNSELVDAKARYWAIKMKTPGFNRAGLTRNPGSEIMDTGVKARFYKLLAAYFERGESAHPGLGKISAVSALMKMEKQVADECGLY